MVRKLILCLLSFLAISSAAGSAPRCFISLDMYDGSLYDFLDNFYRCGQLGRSFVLDNSIDRQLPLRVKLAYDRTNYTKVLQDVLSPLGIQVRQGKYVDAIIPLDTRAYNPGAVGAAVVGSVQVPDFRPSAAPSMDSSDDREGLFLAVLGDSVAWIDSLTLARQQFIDSLQKSNDFAVNVRLELALVSADTLAQYGISEPDFIATVKPRLGLPDVSSNSYALGLHMYNDTASDRQSLEFPVYDSLSISVGPRKRIAQATYSDGKVIESKYENQQQGLSCTILRSRDTVSYSCEYSRDNEASDFVSFRNSLRVGESHSIAYRLQQTITSRQGGLFWWVPWLSENAAQRKRYLLAVGFSAVRS